MVNTAELRLIFPLRENTLRHVVEGDGRYPRAMTPSEYVLKSLFSLAIKLLKVPHWTPFVRGINRWIPLSKGQWCDERFHVIPSSCFTNIPSIIVLHLRFIVTVFVVITLTKNSLTIALESARSHLWEMKIQSTQVNCKAIREAKIEIKQNEIFKWWYKYIYK